MDGLPASLGKNKFGIAQETVTPLTVVKEWNFLVTPASATSLRIKSTWVASMLTRNGRQKDGPPNLSALERGSVGQRDPRAIVPSSRAAQSVRLLKRLRTMGIPSAASHRATTMAELRAGLWGYKMTSHILLYCEERGWREGTLS